MMVAIPKTTVITTTINYATPTQLFAKRCLDILGGLVGSVFALNYSDQKSAETLLPANIEVWVSVKEGSTESSAIESISKQFHETYPDIDITIMAIPESDYKEKIAEAAANDALPTLFESTDISGTVLENAQDITPVLNSSEAKDCLFLSQYHNYYSENKKVPLGIEVPLAYVITSGPVQVDYHDTYFKKISDFNSVDISINDTYKDLIYSSFDLSDYTLVGEEHFLNNDENTHPSFK